MTIRWLDTEVEKKENHTNVGVSILVPSMGWRDHSHSGTATSGYIS